jgi:hypothetical protein
VLEEFCHAVGYFCRPVDESFMKLMLIKDFIGQLFIFADCLAVSRLVTGCLENVQKLI